MFRRILLPLVGTPFTPVAIRHAIELAVAHRASVTGLGVVDPTLARMPRPSLAGHGTTVVEIQERYATQQRRAVDHAAHRLQVESWTAGVDLDLIRGSDSLEWAIERVSADHDLLICGLRGVLESGVVDAPEQAIERIVTNVNCPVLAVADFYRPIHRMLVATDYPADARYRTALRLSDRPKIVLASRRDADRDEAPRLRAELDPHVADARELDGDYNAELLALADELDTDVIVVGNRYRALNLIPEAECSILILNDA